MIEKRETKNGMFDFVVRARNGQVVLYGNEYYTKEARDNGISSVKNNCRTEECYDRKESVNGKHYFNLKAINGQIIGHSEMYESISARENGIESLKFNALNE